MKNLTRSGIIVALFLALVACGDEVIQTAGTDSTDTSTDTTSDTDASTAPAGSTVVLYATNTQLESASDSTVTLTAVVKDSSSRLLTGVAVDWSATSGELSNYETETDDNGKATAVLSPGGDDPSNRTITVTAASGDQSDTFDVQVTGTEISISGSTSLSINEPATLTLALTDSEGVGIPNQTVTVDSSAVTPVSGAMQTDASGQLQLSLSASESGSFTASALNTSVTFSYTVSSETFSVSAASSVEIATCSAISLESEQAATTVDFAISRGTLYSNAACTTEATSVVTDGSGNATMYVESPNPGQFTVTASIDGGPSGSDSGEFVATEAHTLTFQAADPSLLPNESTTLTAVVRDPNNNLVKDTTVNFNIVGDKTSATISPTVDTTDYLGRAQTVFTSTAATSAQEEIEIKATVPDTTLSSSVQLTVGGKARYISIGLSNSLEEENPSTYAWPGAVFVTDANGNGVEDEEVSLSVMATKYHKGARVLVGDTWFAADGNGVVPPAFSCPTEDELSGNPAWDKNGILDTEDVNGNGVLDAGEDLDGDGLIDSEDYNGNDRLDPGNPALVDDTVVTNEYGYAEFDIIYGKDYAEWTWVEITATVGADGSEGEASRELKLLVMAGDVEGAGSYPAGATSPFGEAVSCDDPD